MRLMLQITFYKSRYISKSDFPNLLFLNYIWLRLVEYVIQIQPIVKHLIKLKKFKLRRHVGHPRLSYFWTKNLFLKCQYGREGLITPNFWRCWAFPIKVLYVKREKIHFFMIKILKTAFFVIFEAVLDRKSRNTKKSKFF
jgi:hypothetical protein